jgi:Response regulators consisting of a CheY-like receiver domain and a winged-helix DNA-binding domain
MFTGKDDPLVRSTSLKAGASAFFTKPFDDEEFLTAIRLAFPRCDVAELVCRSEREFPTGFIRENCVFQHGFLNTMPTSSSELVAIERPKTNSRIFAHTRWDIIPVAAGVLHCVYFFGMFYLFPRVPLWVMLILGFIYSVSISWNINGISTTSFTIRIFVRRC